MSRGAVILEVLAEAARLNDFLQNYPQSKRSSELAFAAPGLYLPRVLR